MVWAFRTQPNFRIHLILSACVLAGSVWFGLSRTETVLLIFAVVLGLSAEMVNTALEAMTDLITREWKKEAKIAKDVSAGMMLLTAIGAVVIAVIVFWPHIVPRFLGY
ncbi:diacylglycerol kinase family protein [Patescibacteria group bacterium]|nr:diacylglycerol kinase family protein [Patescibacteria group bacterium]